MTTTLAVAAEEEVSMAGRVAILGWLTLQTSMHSLLLRYSQTRPLVIDGERFLPSVCVLMTELVKASICALGLILAQGFGRLVRLLIK